MSIGNTKDYGNKGNNFPWQLAVLKLLQSIIDNTFGLVSQPRTANVLSTTTAGTTTGLTFTRQFITVTYSAQSNIPFGTSALVTVANITNVTSGTYMVMGTSTTTTVNIGAPSSGTPSLPGTQSLSVSTLTASGSYLRVRAMPPATTANAGNRVEIINHSTTAATYRADTFNISAGAYGTTGVNYAQFVASGGTYTGTGITGTFIRQDTNNTTQPVMLIKHQRTDTSGPNDGDGTDFRLGVAGTSTSANIGRFDSVYRSSTLHEIGMSVSTDSFATNTDRIYIGTADTTKIQCTPAATPSGSLVTVATFTQANTTTRSDALTLTTSAGVPLAGSAVSYNRVWIQAHNGSTVTPASANTPAAFALPSVDGSNVSSIASTSHIVFGSSGEYNIQFSAQLSNSDNASDHTAWIWFRKNGTDIANSATQFIVSKNGGAVCGVVNLLIPSANTTDYVEIAYAVDNTNVTFPGFASTTSPFTKPAIPSIIVTSNPVGA